MLSYLSLLYQMIKVKLKIIIYIYIYISPVALRPNAGHGLIILEVS